MAGKRTLTVEILGDAKGLGQAATAVDGQVKGMSGAFDVLTGKADHSAEGFDAMNRKVNTAMLGAAAGVAAFALDSIAKFQETALEAGKFGDASGLGVDAASRWIAVGDDIGIAADTMQGAFTKFNLAVAGGKSTLDKYGIDIVTAKDGTVDASESFINAATAIGKIKDPTDKAKASQEVFGRSFAEISELMTKDADELRAALDNVSEAQVITDDELQQARDYRDMLDRLTDMAGDFQIALGTKLIPMLIDMAEKFEGIIDKAGKMDGAIEKITGSGLAGWVGTMVDIAVPLDNVMSGLDRTFDGNASAGARLFGVAESLAGAMPIVGEQVSWLGTKIFPEVTSAVDDSKGSLAEYLAEQERTESVLDPVITGQKEFATAIQEGQKRTIESSAALEAQAVKLDLSQAAAQRARDEQYRLAEATKRVEDRIRDEMAAWDEITGKLDDEQAIINLAQQFDDMGTEIYETQIAMNEGTLSVEEGMRKQALAINETKQDVVGYIEKIGDVPPSKVTEYLAMIDQGKWDEVEARLQTLARNRTMELSIIAKGGSGNFKVVGVPAFAEGGVMPGPRGVHQLAMVAGGETILPTHKRGVSAGGDIHITINAGSLVHERDLARSLYDAILDAQRRGEIPGGFN